MASAILSKQANCSSTLLTPTGARGDRGINKAPSYKPRTIPPIMAAAVTIARAPLLDESEAGDADEDADDDESELPLPEDPPRLPVDWLEPPPEALVRGTSLPAVQLVGALAPKLICTCGSPSQQMRLAAEMSLLSSFLKMEPLQQ